MEPEKAGKYVDTLSHCDSDVRGAMNEIKRAETLENGVMMRADERLPFDGPVAVQVAVEHPGGSMGRFLVKSYNISARGLGFLHGGYIHVGAKCLVAIFVASRKAVVVNGRVMRCTCLRGRVHDVGVKFSKPIDPVQIIEMTERGDSHSVGSADLAYNSEELGELVQDLRRLTLVRASLPELHAKLEEVARAMHYPLVSAGELEADGGEQEGDAPMAEPEVSPSA